MLAVKSMNRMNKYCTGLLLVVALVVGLAGCKSSRQSAGIRTACLSSKVKLTIPHKDAVFTVHGTMKLRSKERMQVSFLMPILRTEVARMDITPDEVMLVDRMGKRYVHLTRAELKELLPRKADFAHLEKMLFKAAQPGGKRALEGKDLGISKLEKCRIELTDFSDKSFTMTPTQLSSRYRKVEPEELLQLLMDLLE